MKPVNALKAVLALSLFGVAFSGILSYREVFGQSALACPAPGAPGTVLGYPACVYGFFMYAAIAILAALGLRQARLANRASSAGRDASPAVNVARR